MRLWPSGIRVLALKPAERGRGTILVLQAIERRGASVRLEWLGAAIPLGRMAPGSIVAWRLAKRAGVWSAGPASALD